jgi:hypothetical protein
VVHRHRHGGDLSRLRLSLEENGGVIGHLVVVTRRCTGVPEAMYTGVSSEHLKPAALGPSLPSLGGTALGVAVPPDRGWRCHLGTSTSSPSCKLLRDSIHVNLSYSPQAMLSLKVLSQNILELS